MCPLFYSILLVASRWTCAQIRNSVKMPLLEPLLITEAQLFTLETWIFLESADVPISKMDLIQLKFKGEYHNILCHLFRVVSSLRRLLFCR